MFEKKYFWEKVNYLGIYFFIVFIFIVYTFDLKSQNEIKFKHLTVRDGLSQSWVKCIYQDKDGYLWIGTGGAGINKYNGYEFKVYKQDPKDNKSLSSNIINVFYEDKKGNLWVGAQNGLNIYDRETDRFLRYPVLLNENILGIYEPQNGKLIVVANDIIYKINSENYSAKSIYSLEDGEYNGDNFYTKIIEDIKGNLWIGSIHNGIFLIDTINNNFVSFKHKENNPKSLSDNYIHCIYRDSKDRIWIGTNSKGISLLNYENNNPSKIEFINLMHDPLNKNSINEGAIRAILDDNMGNLWIGTENGGLDILDLKEFEKGNVIFKHYLHIPNDETSISNNSIYSIYKDNVGTIWIGTYGNGLNYYNKLLFKFQHFRSTFGNKNCLNNNLVNVIFEEGDDLWIGTEGGLNLLDKNTGIFHHFVHDQNNDNTIGSNAVWALYKDSRNNFWIGTWAGGLNLFIRETNTFKRFLHDKDDPNTIGSNNVFGILEDKDGDLWIACMNGGLNKFDYKTQSFKKYLADGSGNCVTNNWVRTLIETSYGEIWISTSESVQLFNKEKEEFTTFIKDTANALSISYNGAIVLFEDSKRNLWLGTEGGLNLFIREDSSFIYYSKQEGLPDDAIKGICEDDHGNLWLSTNKGISKFINGTNHPENPEFKNFDIGDGLQGIEFNRRSFCKGKDGRMYFGGTNGFNVFHPDSIKDNLYKPNIIFTNFLIFNKPVEIGGEDSPLSKHISKTKEIVLPYKYSVITIEYSTLSYIVPEKNKYAYMLEGFDPDKLGWNNVGSQRSATYTNLDPGKYTFRVKASNNDDLWNEQGISLKINILPPWWKTWWFRILLGLFIIGSAISFYLIRINQIKKQKKELEHQVIIRTHKLQEANEELKTQKEEILAQNEEIQQQAEELAAQRDALEHQNEEIKTKNEQISNAFDNMRILSEFGQKVSAMLNVEAINNMIYDYVSTLMDLSAFGIGLLNETKQIIEYNVYYEKDKRLPYFNKTLNDKTSFTTWCIMNKEIVFSNDLKKDYKKYVVSLPKMKTSFFPHSVIQIPLIIETKAIGIITINNSKKNAYTKNDVDKLQSLASYITIALDNAHAYEIINKQNIHIKNSMEYAKTIQNSILPVEKNVGKYFESLIIYKPKDIVSGDFYWFTTEMDKEGKELVFFAVVDCTGHGVPGAFMSLIGCRLMSEIVNQKKVLNPAQILEFLNIGIQISLKQDQTDNNDGMDICLCRIERQEKEKYKLIFSGAKRPLYIYKNRNTHIERIPGARKSIGGIRAKRSKLFYSNNEIIISKGDILYLTTDGFVDQNAPDRTKFGSLRMLKLLEEIKDKPLNEQKEMLEKELKNHMKKEEQRDDITFVGLKLL